MYEKTPGLSVCQAAMDFFVALMYSEAFQRSWTSSNDEKSMIVQSSLCG